MQTSMTVPTSNSPSVRPETSGGSAPVSKIPGVFAGKAWQQVLARDRSADGQFVYAVKSTRIFCRPSCPSRRPTRKSVTFFPSPALAEAAGYRACKRCQPTLAAPRPDPHAEALGTVTSYLKEHATERTTLDQVARATGVPRLTILRGFKRVLGVTPAQFAREQRLAAFKDRLKPSAQKNSARVTDAIYDAGFGSSSRLYEGSPATLGMRPAELRSGAPTLTIRYAIADSPLGRTLVAATPVGICAIAFGHSDAVLRHDLRERFPQATLIEATSGATRPGGASAGGRPDGRSFPELAGRRGPVRPLTDVRAPWGCAVPTRHPRHRVSASRLGGSAAYSTRRDTHLYRGGGGAGTADGGAGGGLGVRGKPRRARHSVPSRCGSEGGAHRISLGPGAERGDSFR